MKGVISSGVAKNTEARSPIMPAGMMTGFSGRRAGVARIGLEAEIGFPEISRFAIGRRHEIAVVADSDGGHLFVGTDFFEVCELGRHRSHHSLPHAVLPRRGSPAGTGLFKEGDQLSALARIRDAGKRSARHPARTCARARRKAAHRSVAAHVASRRAPGPHLELCTRSK